MAHRLSGNRLQRRSSLFNSVLTLKTLKRGLTSNATQTVQESPHHFHPTPQASRNTPRQKRDLPFIDALDRRHMVLVSPDGTISPRAPREVEMLKADLLWVRMSSVSEIPAKLDIDKLRAALSKTLAVYRPACGRIRRNSATDWKILLTDSPMPMEVVESPNPPQFDGYVDQPREAIAPLLPSVTSAPHEVINNDVPPVTLKVTLSAEKTMLGMSWNHAIGDGMTRFRFMSLLSRYYQGLNPLFPLPSFARHHFLDPTGEDAAAKPEDGFAYFRTLGGSREASSQSNMYTPNDVVRWIFPRTEAKILRENIQQSLGMKVSVQDCLTAYITSLVHKCGHDMRRINYTFSLRGPGLAMPELAGNLSMTMPLLTLEDAEARDPRRVALKIRQGVMASRTPEGVAECMRQLGTFLHYCSEKGGWTTMYKCISIPHTLCANSMGSINWQEAVNFGHSGAKYYVGHFHELPFYLRIHPANPTAGRSSSDDLDVSFPVPKPLYPKVLEKLEDKGHLVPFS